MPGIGDIGGLLGFCNAGSSGLIGDLNNICQPSIPAPEPANGGIDSLIQPPATAGKAAPTLYDSYGMAGQSWAAYDMQCSDMTSLIGNSVAGMVFDAAKALDRVTITVYQSAAGEGILSWLTNSVDRLITSLGNAIYFPYLAPVVILGALWLAWQGLIRKRATRTIEGTIWMVIACTAAIWLIARPADFTGMGKTVSDGITQTLNVAFAGLPAPAESNCVPVGNNDPQVKTASFSYTGGSSIVDQNANELWTVLVCKPWLDGEFGTTVYTTGKGAKPTVVNQYGRQLLWAQAIATNENPTSTLITAKENTYAGIAASIKQNDPAVYSLFQGNQYPTRLEIAFAALFAALVAGVLVLLIAITLIILKLGFLLLLVAGPFFLIVGTHPGFGRVVALRWFEMLIGVLLKQAAIALVLSVLLYAYSLIMGTSDATLPWALKILMIALVTVAVFIYRKPFVHLFSAVGYGMVGSRERSRHRTGPCGRRGPAEHGGRGHGGRARVRGLPGRALGPAQPGPGGRRGRVGRDGGWRGRGRRGGGRRGCRVRRGRVRRRPAGHGQRRGPVRGRLPECLRPGQPGQPGPRPGHPGRRQQPSRRAAAGPAGPGRHRPAPGLRLVPVRRRGHRYRPVPGQRPGPRPARPPRQRHGQRGHRPGRQPRRRQLVAARWPGVAPRPPAAAPPPSGPARSSGGPARSSGPARPRVGSGSPARSSGARSGSPARSSGGAAPPPTAPPAQPPGAAPPWFGAPSRSGPPQRTQSPARGADAGSAGSPARSPSPARGPARSAPPTRSRPTGPGSGGSQPGGGAAEDRGNGRPDSPPGPFWLRPVRRKK